jgi:uncharacterized membrane protein YphA (DoxX/SURF4 family)
MKIMAIYAVQILLALVFLLAGAAKFAGASIMVQPLAAIGLGDAFRFAAGALELIGGLCLLLPRAAMLGAVLLSCTAVMLAGAAVGHIAARDGSAMMSAHNGTPAVFRADLKSYPVKRMPLSVEHSSSRYGI